MQDNRTPADLARYAEGAKKVDPMARARLDEIVSAGRIPQQLDVQVLASLSQLPVEAQRQACDTFHSNDLSAVRIYLSMFPQNVNLRRFYRNDY
jgi:hypothetical protein